MHLRRPLTGPTCQVSCLQVKDTCDVQVGTQVTLFNWQAHQCFQLGDREKQSSNIMWTQCNPPELHCLHKLLLRQHGVPLRKLLEGGKSHMENEPEAVPGHELLVSFRKPSGKLPENFREFDLSFCLRRAEGTCVICQPHAFEGKKCHLHTCLTYKPKTHVRCFIPFRHHFRKPSGSFRNAGNRCCLTSFRTSFR